MIAEFHVQETSPNPFEYDFAMVGGLKGEVTVAAMDARGVDCPVDWTVSRTPEDGLTWAVRVVLRPEWVYPVKITLERPVSSEETSG